MARTTGRVNRSNSIKLALIAKRDPCSLQEPRLNSGQTVLAKLFGNFNQLPILDVCLRRH